MIAQCNRRHKDTGMGNFYSCVVWKGISVPASTDLEAFNRKMEYSYKNIYLDLRLAVMDLKPAMTG